MKRFLSKVVGVVGMLTRKRAADAVIARTAALNYLLNNYTLVWVRPALFPELNLADSPDWTRYGLVPVAIPNHLITPDMGRFPAWFAGAMVSQGPNGERMPNMRTMVNRWRGRDAPDQPRLVLVVQEQEPPQTYYYESVLDNPRRQLVPNQAPFMPGPEPMAAPGPPVAPAVLPPPVASVAQPWAPVVAPGRVRRMAIKTGENPTKSNPTWPRKHPRTDAVANSPGLDSGVNVGAGTSRELESPILDLSQYMIEAHPDDGVNVDAGVDAEVHAPDLYAEAPAVNWDELEQEPEPAIVEDVEEPVARSGIPQPHHNYQVGQDPVGYLRGLLRESREPLPPASPVPAAVPPPPVASVAQPLAPVVAPGRVRQMAFKTRQKPTKSNPTWPRKHSRSKGNNIVANISGFNIEDVNVGASTSRELEHPPEHARKPPEKECGTTIEAYISDDDEDAEEELAAFNQILQNARDANQRAQMDIDQDPDDAIVEDVEEPVTRSRTPQPHHNYQVGQDPVGYLRGLLDELREPLPPSPPVPAASPSSGFPPSQIPPNAMGSQAGSNQATDPLSRAMQVAGLDEMVATMSQVGSNQATDSLSMAMQVAGLDEMIRDPSPPPRIQTPPPRAQTPPPSAQMDIVQDPEGAIVEDVEEPAAAVPAAVPPGFNAQPQPAVVAIRRGEFEDEELQAILAQFPDGTHFLFID